MRKKLQLLKEKQELVRVAKQAAQKEEQELNAMISQTLGIDVSRPADIISVAEMVMRVQNEIEKG